MHDPQRMGPRTNIVLSLIILAGCAAGWLATDTLPRGLPVDPVGPAYFPRFIVLCITVLATALLGASLLALRRGSIAEDALVGPLPFQASAVGLEAASLTPEEEVLPPISYPRMIGVLAVSVGYVLLIGTFGYFFATLLYVVVLLLLLQARNTLAIAGCALGAPLVLQTLFGKLLTVPLPGGLLDRLPFSLPF